MAIDNSYYATKVMNRALELASLYNSSLLGISVIDNSYFSDESSSYSTDTQSYWTSSFQYIIDECAKLADETDVFYQHELLNGNPAEEIIRYAEQKGIDFIVIGHLGKSAASGFLIGSVVQKVASHSKCSVFIVK